MSDRTSDAEKIGRAFEKAFLESSKALLAWSEALCGIVEVVDFATEETAARLGSYGLLWGHDGARCLASKRGHRPDSFCWPLWN